MFEIPSRAAMYMNSLNDVIVQLSDIAYLQKFRLSDFAERD